MFSVMSVHQSVHKVFHVTFTYDGLGLTVQGPRLWLPPPVPLAKTSDLGPHPWSQTPTSDIW